MKRILLGLVTIVGAASAMYVGATGAFFSDTETSTGNTFAAGAIDLKIDNESYYNGVLNPDTSWDLIDLTVQKFFNFLDLKPDDYGEDTISIHVDTNDAYMCAEVELTSNDDNGINEPESAVDQTDGPGNGELAGLVNFIWWADDGDNVLETDETPLPGGPLGALGIGQTATLALADSSTNIWTGVGGPVPGDQTLYLGKAWCFGTIGTEALTPGEYPSGPAGDNNGNQTAGEPEDGGITCDGTGLGNESQTDRLTADITFNAVQARNNPKFLCLTNDCSFDDQVDLLTAAAKFENPDVNTSQNWDVFDSPVDGWNVEWRGDIPATFGSQNRPDVAHLEYHEGVLGAAFEGDQYAELDSDWGGPTDNGQNEPASVSIYRNFATVPGANYVLRFQFAPRPNTPGADNNLETKVEGVAFDTTGPVAGGGGPIAWQERTVNFTATDASTEIRFTDLGTANSLGTFLDNVRLYQISCPNQIVQVND
jgi:predicted ribosomally synthesized peptide with SipW-like signal peptide